MSPVIIGRQNFIPDPGRPLVCYTGQLGRNREGRKETWGFRAKETIKAYYY